MIRDTIYAVAALAAVSIFVSCLAAQPPMETRQVTVSVVVTPAVGTLPAHTSVVLGGDGKAVVAELDANNTAVVTGQFSVASSSAWVAIGAVVPSNEGEQALAGAQRIIAERELRKRFSVPPETKVLLTPGVDSYSVTIALAEAITIRGRTMNGSRPLDVNAIRAYGPVLYGDGRDGRFEVHGVEKGKAGSVP